MIKVVSNVMIKVVRDVMINVVSDVMINEVSNVMIMSHVCRKLGGGKRPKKNPRTDEIRDRRSEIRDQSRRDQSRIFSDIKSEIFFARRKGVMSILLS